MNTEEQVQLLNLSINQVIKTVTEELSSGNIIYTSKSKITSDKYFYTNEVNEGEEMVIVGLKFNMVRQFLLVNKNDYIDVIENGKNEKLKQFYSQLSNGWENCKKKELDIKTIKLLNDYDFENAFEYIFIKKKDGEYCIKIECEEIEIKENEMKCEICQ